MRVAVIGAGAAGLCSGYHLKRHDVDFIIFEGSSRIGGTWIYHETTTDELGESVHSSCYRDLRSNLPGHIMSFPRFPFKAGLEGFVHRSAVLEYLDDYCASNGLRERIRFGHKVIEVDPQSDKRWRIEIRVANNGDVYHEMFDAVMACPGRFSVPMIPKIEGLSEHFRGAISHSHAYRTREPFAGQRVLVIGASLSGLDITFELSTVCCKVFLSARYGCLTSLPDNVELVQEVERVERGPVIVAGTRRIENVDAVVFCTGYRIEYAFVRDLLYKTGEVSVEPLYKHLIHIDYPTLCFVGLPYKTVPFIMFDYQVQYFIGVLLNNIELPSKDEMNKDFEADKQRRRSLGQAARHLHVFDGDLLWEYFDWFVQNTPGVEPYGGRLRRSYEQTIHARLYDAGCFRDNLKFS